MQRQVTNSTLNVYKLASTSATAARRLDATRRHFSGSSSRMQAVNNMTVFGGGLMGAGIAQVASQHGIKVTLCDLTDQALATSKTMMQKSLSRIANKKHPDSKDEQQAYISSVFDNVTLTTDPALAVKDADLVIEAIVENIKVKKELFRMLDEECSAKTIFASNTSSLSISEIASATSQARRAKFGGVHFFNPVPQMKLVEVIRTEETSDETFQSLLDVCKRMQKHAVSCKDTPGFIVNRLLVPYMFESVRMLERGDATAEDIDAAMKLGAGYPMGPFELIDFVGLDTAQHILDGWRQKVESGQADSLSSDLVAPSALLSQKVKEGKLGRKSGEGFYKYN
ncbi:3-hydroxyacyl-CoA dehyrogenase [Calocera viscosa TUFC12733]|uniref:3-hydroxyacyl-CoA dehydrogenase n=1 Tax=Calocera viscosa (strain TUFC12733) TaxID=1330018 RepID=A0A167JH23_CALVF|nr:3-hydroxyacyl-CoA dehyrogenase [Calocera viscosa TUFC12733]